jgi:hypothetical protein
VTTLKDQEDALDAMENGNQAALAAILIEFLESRRRYRMPPTPLDYAEALKDEEDPERFDGMG